MRNVNLLSNNYSYIWCVHHRTNAMSLVTVFHPMGHVHMYVTCTFSLLLGVLETIHRVLQCSNANCDWSVTSVKALSHIAVTLALPPSPCMHVSLLSQTNSLEYQLQEAAYHRYRLGILIYPCFPFAPAAQPGFDLNVGVHISSHVHHLHG